MGAISRLKSTARSVTAARIVRIVRRKMRHILFRGECVDGGALEFFAAAENDGWELRLVHGIGKMLGFEAEAGVLEVVAGVELDAGFGGADGHGSAGC